METKCLIYCRVSSLKQVEEGHGLDTQEKRCRDFALSKHYKIKKVFREEGVSGGLFERPKIQELITYLDKYPTEHFVIIFDDLSRFARDVSVHLKLKMELVEKRGAILECLNFNFENSPVGELVEIILAGVSEYHRKDNRRQVIQKMKARLELGFWCFRSPPLGLSYKKDPIVGKVLVPVTPYYMIFREAIESYDRGLFNTLEETRQFIEAKYKEYGISKKTSISGTKAILSELLYTGYYVYPKWGITERRKGKHEGFINLTIFDRVQEKMKKKAKFAARKDYDLDFPLRPVTLCDSCGGNITGAWVHGRTEKYPRYWCRNKQCMLYGKSIRRDDIETRFEALLKSSKPCDEVIELSRKMFFVAWSDKAGNFNATQAQIRREIDAIDKDILDLSGQLAKKLASNDQVMVGIYENQIKKLTEKSGQLKGNLGAQRYTLEQFRTAKDKVFDTLKEPVAMWKSDEYKDKLTIFAMYFDEKLRYDMKAGFRTATLALPVALMKQSETQKNSLVEMPGVEPGSKETPLKKFSER